MKKFNIFIILSIICIFIFAKNDTVKNITNEELLLKIDNAISGPKSRYMKIKLITIDKNDNKKEKVLEIYQKNDKKIGKFLSPPMDKGLAFLSLPDNTMYLYLPAYKKIKRIIASKKGGKFAGTDFSYEDMELKSFKDNYTCEILSSDSLFYYIKLIKKTNNASIYKYSHVKIDKKTFYPMEIQYFNKKDVNTKTMQVITLDTIDGFLIPTHAIMKNNKNSHRTEMFTEDIKINIDIKDETFTKRYLEE